LASVVRYTLLLFVLGCFDKVTTTDEERLLNRR
jgi:hypothetical protein